jgi:hypothetical protein
MVFLSAGIMKKGNNFIIYTISCVIFFGILYYLVQLYDKNAFVNDNDNDMQGNTPYKFGIFECLHLSLVTQCTFGYGRMRPISKLSIFVNSLQLFSVIFITASIF